MEMAGLVDDEVLNTIAVVGTPAEVAGKIAARFKGRVERISPVAYAPDVKLLAVLCREIRALV
jgi:alkanesulfonate monooxygenase SsuD/methylene tetrahydromethanopterin reductase-like flavin-dependent oxidoreductase (luciferase family)